MPDIKSYFTFVIVNRQMPDITINGEKLHISGCCYSWSTATERCCESCMAVVHGYLGSEQKLRYFELDFKTGKPEEIDVEKLL